MNEPDRFTGLSADALNEAETESVVKLACEVMAAKVAKGPVVTGDKAAAKYVQLKTAGSEREVVGCLFLTTRNRLIRDEALFYGTIDRTSVYLRVLLQKALEYNAGAAILFHNHPSGSAEPSASDIELTRRAKDLLDEIDVRLLDHIVVSRTGTVSMASRGLV